MKVKIKYVQVMHETGKATLFSIKGIPMWFPNFRFKYGQGNYIICDEWLAREKGLFDYKPLYHVPDKIEPVKNQKANDELVFTSDK